MTRFREDEEVELLDDEDLPPHKRTKPAARYHLAERFTTAGGQRMLSEVSGPHTRDDAIDLLRGLVNEEPETFANHCVAEWWGPWEDVEPIVEAEELLEVTQ